MSPTFTVEENAKFYFKITENKDVKTLKPDPSPKLPSSFLSLCCSAQLKSIAQSCRLAHEKFMGSSPSSSLVMHSDAHWAALQSPLVTTHASPTLRTSANQPECPFLQLAHPDVIAPSGELRPGAGKKGLPASQGEASLAAHIFVPKFLPPVQPP